MPTILSREQMLLEMRRLNEECTRNIAEQRKTYSDLALKAEKYKWIEFLALLTFLVGVSVCTKMFL